MLSQDHDHRLDGPVSKAIGQELNNRGMTEVPENPDVS